MMYQLLPAFGYAVCLAWNSLIARRPIHSMIDRVGECQMEKPAFIGISLPEFRKRDLSPIDEVAVAVMTLPKC